MDHRLRSLLPTVLLAALACGEGPGVTLPPGGDGETSADPGFGQAWLGLWEGRGDGVAGAMAMDLDPARLVVVPDADSVKSPGCPGCVTLTLDTLFAAANVRLPDPQRVVVGYLRGGVRRTLWLERFSGGGGTANVVLGRLSVEGGAGVVLKDLTLVLERR